MPDSQSPEMDVEKKLWLESQVSNPCPLPCHQGFSQKAYHRGISLSQAKGYESHRGKGWEKKCDGFHKEALRPTYPITAVYIREESPRVDRVVKWVRPIALRPPHALVGHRSSRIIAGHQEGCRVESWWEGRGPAYQTKCTSTVSCVDHCPGSNLKADV